MPTCLGRQACLIELLFLKCLHLNINLMFLSKKTATSFNKPKPKDTNKGKRMLGGWNDDEQEKADTAPKEIPLTNHQPIINLLGNDFVQPTPEKQLTASNLASETVKKDYFDWDALNQKTDIDIEKGIIEQIVRPSGIRIKQSDNVLNDFLKEVKFLEISVIGSLLLSKIEANYSFQVKAKALYAIEFLVKKNEEYLKYFQSHADKLRDFPEPEDNVESYRKIWKTLMNVIGMPPANNHQEEKPQFIDPGYNTEPTQPQTKSGIINFIHQNANKSKKGESHKAFLGPGQQKQKVQVKKQTNLLEYDFTTHTTTSNQDSLV